MSRDAECHHRIGPGATRAQERRSDPAGENGGEPVYIKDGITGQQAAPAQAASRRIGADAAAMAVAARQHGVVTRRQLLEAGLSSEGVARRVRKGWLKPLHRGVYVMGPLPLPYARLQAAVLACGAGAAVSHHSGLELWKLPITGRDAQWIDITLAGGDRRRPGIRVHRGYGLREADVTEREGIPVTTPARTLLDVSSLVPGRALERVVAAALAGGLTSRAAILEVLDHNPGRPGAGRLRNQLQAEGPALTRSEAEEKLLVLIRRGRLPAPEVNAIVAGYEVDFFWRSERFAAEVDGFRYHGSAQAFESDRLRDAVLAASGIRVVRITWRQLVDDAEAVLVRLAQALVRSG